MTEKERTNFFFFFFFARVCVSDVALFEAKVCYFEAKKQQSFGQFQRDTDAHAFKSTKDEHETIAEILREKR
jgi:hypothetical protein